MRCTGIPDDNFPKASLVVCRIKLIRMPMHLLLTNFRDGYLKTVTSIRISDEWMHIYYLSSFLQLQLLPLNVEFKSYLAKLC